MFSIQIKVFMSNKNNVWMEATKNQLKEIYKFLQIVYTTSSTSVTKLPICAALVLANLTTNDNLLCLNRTLPWFIGGDNDYTLNLAMKRAKLTLIMMILLNFYDC